MASFPTFRASSADPFERGRQLGAASAAQVRGSVDVYTETFAHYTGLAWPEVRELAARFHDPIAAYDPEIAREIEGIAAGAELAVEDVLAINARSEIMFGLKVVPPSECTSFYVGPSASADGHVLLGQNWDWRPRTSETTILAEIEQGDRPAFVMCAEAGLVGKIGFNAAGIGVAANALVSDLDRGEPGVPFHVVLRGILNARTLEEAVGAVIRARRSASANYVIGSATGHGVNVETGPGGVEHAYLTHPEGDLLAHSNHFRCAISFCDVAVGEWLDSPVRVQTMADNLERDRGTLSLASIPALLTDHTGAPNSVCRHPDESLPVVERNSTVASWVIDLTDRVASLCRDTPCTGEFVPVTPAFAAETATAGAA
jgi:isopenicillin-N N-acyltransferase-like protein